MNTVDHTRAMTLVYDTTIGIGPWELNIGLVGGLVVLGLIVVLVIANLK
ncbi:hypothetical protein [Streptomonospora mangrovi]|nr:hypothetical protein [Streptomonospora mangrovi]